MTLTYRPTRKMVGDNARSLEFELRKIQQKIQQIYLKQKEMAI